VAFPTLSHSSSQTYKTIVSCCPVSLPPNELCNDDVHRLPFMTAAPTVCFRTAQPFGSGQRGHTAPAPSLRLVSGRAWGVDDGHPAARAAETLERFDLEEEGWQTHSCRPVRLRMLVMRCVFSSVEMGNSACVFWPPAPLVALERAAAFVWREHWVQAMA